jgi:predicted DsbA family dithiol-disulfide isomerase
MAYAHEKGGEPLQRKLAESCFTSYFEKELDVGQPEQLVTNSVHSGVFGTEDDARKFLQSDAFDQEIKKGYREAQGLGISGVPFFIFENKFAVSGAQPPEAFVEVFERLSKDKKSQPELVEGAACEIGGKC